MKLGNFAEAAMPSHYTTSLHLTLLGSSPSLILISTMKIFVNLSPKRLFASKKSRSHVSRSDPSSFSSGSSSDDASLHKPSHGTPTSVLPHTWSHLNFDLQSPPDAVSIKELQDLLARLGPDPPTQEEVLVMLKELGCDGDGCVSMEALLGRVGSACDDELRETFEFFDTDRDGRITAQELLGVFKAMGDERCTLDDCRRMIAVVDENKDGFVCFEDFSRMMELQR